MKRWTSFFNKFVAKKDRRFWLCTLYLTGMICLCLGLNLASAPFTLSVSATEGESLAPDALQGLVVVLDPGHGGYDGGAKARSSGLWEKEITLKVAQEIERALVAHGAKVVLTRREDTDLCGADTGTLKRKRADLQARVDIAKEAGAHVLLSIHMNEYRSSKESGPQVFYQRGGEDGRLLAGALQQSLIAGLKPKKERVAMAGDYFVLRSAIPSALVECGFISNPEEERLLLTQEYQQQIGEAVAQGLAEYRTLLERRNKAE